MLGMDVGNKVQIYSSPGSRLHLQHKPLPMCCPCMIILTREIIGLFQYTTSIVAQAWQTSFSHKPTAEMNIKVNIFTPVQC